MPLSGAVDGFGGDVYAVKDGSRELFELKSRASSFTKIYDLFGHEATVEGFLGLSFNGGKCLVGISMDFELLKSPDRLYVDTVLLAKAHPRYTRTLSKIFNLQKLLKGSDYLVIRDDRRPFLFLKYHA